MKGLSLYQLNAEVMEIVLSIEAAELHECDELIEDLIDELEEAQDAIAKKRESYVHVLRSAEAQANALREESTRFLARARAMENLSKRLKQALHDDLVEKGEDCADAGIFKLGIYQSPPKVVFRVPIENLPSEYKKVTVRADTSAISDTIRNGGEVEGAELDYGTHIRIR